MDSVVCFLRSDCEKLMFAMEENLKQKSCCFHHKE